MTISASTADDVLTLEAQRTSAMVNADVIALDALMLESCRHVHSNGFVDTKHSYLEKLRSGAVRYLRMDASEHPHVVDLGATSVVLSLPQLRRSRATAAHEPCASTRPPSGTAPRRARGSPFQATSAPPAA